jgi:transforming growth factor-beta-induced protein
MKNYYKKDSLWAMIIVVLLVLVSTTSCDDDFTSPALPSGSAIADLVVANSEFDLLESALVKTGLASSFANANSGQFTVFAPNDAAFVSFIQSTYSLASAPTEQEAIDRINALTNTSSPLNLGTLVGRLNYHILTSELKSSQITGAQTFATLNGARLSLSLSGSSVLLNTGTGSTGGNVVSADADATNGVVHTIDKVLAVPSTSTTVLSPLGMSVSYATATPSVSGGLETSGDATGTDFDILAYAIRKSNLATVLVPNATPLPDFTIFAPNDNAMRAYLGDTAPAATKPLEDAAIAFLKSLTPEQVADILKYHVISGRYLSTDLSNGKTLNTLLNSASFNVAISGDPVPTVSLVDKNAAVDPVVIATNNVNNNGVVHTINAVLKSN